MIRLLTFAVVMGALMLYFYLSSKPRRPRVDKQASQAKPKHVAKGSLADDFWMQVYDTDSTDEARKIQARFHDMNIQCFLYEQGKKDVFGNRMKHYGISVPRRSSERAQEILAQITL